MTTSPSRILVVDDLEDWRRTLGGLLEDEGFAVTLADAHESAIAALRSGAFDLALIDMRLKDAEEGNTAGLDLAREIKGRWPGIKIVVITGYDSTETARRAREPDAEGQCIADEYVLKENVRELPSVIQRILTDQ